MRFSLPDKDVFVIDALANPPVQRAGSSGFYTGVGTILYNMIVNPVSGKVYVTNTDAKNDLRFEGPGSFAGETLRGHLHESRITVLGPGGVAPRHLNKHINYASCRAPLPNPENERSLALPQGMAITSNGATLYVAALGSSKIGILNTAALENDTFTPSAADHIPVSGGGPRGWCSIKRAAASTRSPPSTTRSPSSTPPRAPRWPTCRCTAPSRPASPMAGGFFTTRNSRPATGTRRARAAMCSAISIAWPGTSAIRMR